MLRALIEPTPLRVPGAASAWYFPLGTAAFAVSFSVNAIVATLLAIKIYTLQQYAKQKHRSHPVRNMISIFNDSGMLMLACQIVWLALFHRNNVGFVLVRGPFVMIYVRNQMFPPPSPSDKILLLTFILTGINTNAHLPANLIIYESNVFK